MVFSKGQGIEKTEIETELVEADSTGMEEKTREKLERCGFYKLCTRCPSINDYQEYLKVLELVSDRNAKNYSDHISYILQKCCDKNKGLLESSDVILGDLIIYSFS